QRRRGGALDGGAGGIGLERSPRRRGRRAGGRRLRAGGTDRLAVAGREQEAGRQEQGQDGAVRSQGQGRDPGGGESDDKPLAFARRRGRPRVGRGVQPAERQSMATGSATSASITRMPSTTPATRSGSRRSTSAKVSAVPSRKAATRSARARAWRPAW